MSEARLKDVYKEPYFTESSNGDPEIQLTCISNLFMRSMHFKHAGDIEHGHAHLFDHVSLLTAGAARVTVEGVSKEFTAPHAIFIRRDWMHEIEALEDNTIMICVHALRDGERAEDIVSPDSYVIQPGGGGIESTTGNLYPLMNVNHLP